MRMVSPPSSVISLRVFGSFCRGDFDQHSDVDILVVHQEKPTTGARAKLQDELSSAFDRNVDLAEYSPVRLKQMFSHGHLFTWHLYSESKNLMRRRDDFFDSLSTPAPYRYAKRDANRFLSLLASSGKELHIPGASPVYEAGLLYLGSRNIGLSTSWEVLGRPDFSRHSIHQIANELNTDLGVTKCEYERLVECRFATMRGLKIDPPSITWARNAADALISGCTKICEQVFGKSIHD